MKKVISISRMFDAFSSETIYLPGRDVEKSLPPNMVRWAAKLILERVYGKRKDH